MELEKLRMQIDEIDKEMAKLFEKRMEIVTKVGEYKKVHNLPVLDKNREHIVIEKNRKYISNKEYLPYYDEFIKHLMNLAKKHEK